MIQRIKIGKRHYASIPNQLLRDKRLSCRATAVLVYLLSFPENWEPRSRDVCARFHLSKRVMTRVFAELRELGYAELKSQRNGETGKWGGSRYIIRETTLHDTEAPFLGYSVGGRVNIVPILKKTDVPLRRRENDDSMFAFDDEVPKFIKAASTKLEDYVRALHKISPTIKRKNWYKEMILLLQTLEGDKRRLKKVLLGYISSDNAKHKPQAWCASSFRKKFLQIEAWVEKENPPIQKEEYVIEETEVRYHK